MEGTEKSKAKRFPVVVTVNLAILVIYTLYLRLSYGRDYDREYAFMFDAFLIGAQVVLCLIIAVFTRPREFLLSAGLVLAIGFGTCVVGIG